jgi:hypothetical protein
MAALKFPPLSLARLSLSIMVQELQSLPARKNRATENYIFNC